MSTTSPSSLEEVIRKAGEGWLIDSFDPPANGMSHILQTLDAVQREARNRLGNNAPDTSEMALVREYRRNPLKVRGFFQALGGTKNPQMLLMVWRIMQGMEVLEIHMDYELKRSFEIRVVLQSPYGEKDPPYRSANIQDFALFRHLGILEIGTAPVFDGFYALKVRGLSK